MSDMMHMFEDGGRCVSGGLMSLALFPESHLVVRTLRQACIFF